MELEMLLGLTEEEAHHQEALDAMQRLLDHLDAQLPDGGEAGA
jgi:hypothetical protein